MSEAGHKFLAKLGKKRLRPGGKRATDWLIAEGEFSKEKRILEVACNRGTTAIELAQRFGCKITAVDMDAQALEVAKKFAALKERVMDGGYAFHQLFPVILTDNGSEFSYVEELERDIDGKSHLYFCDPSRPDQKGRIEKNHTVLRAILPKGTSFDQLTQKDVNLVISHVNSLKREEFQGKSAYDVFTFNFGEDIAALLGCQFVKPEDTHLSPDLLK